ncbi:unnamed protein product [Lymnaea stagnalis]|uniref:Uncharacterized protein n=1 Tax=Lymnaea stagnalis TaxID=6523 RepID=A0AAV2IL15_LYMST
METRARVQGRFGSNITRSPRLGLQNQNLSMSFPTVPSHHQTPQKGLSTSNHVQPSLGISETAMLCRTYDHLSTISEISETDNDTHVRLPSLSRLCIDTKCRRDPPNIRLTERNEIIQKIYPGSILQVCGPPMTGKSTIVEQVIGDIRRHAVSANHGAIIYHPIMCRGLICLHDVLSAVMRKLKPGTFNENIEWDVGYVLQEIQSLLELCSSHHNVFVFHKCEHLRTSGRDHEFLIFLSQLVNTFLSLNFKVSVVFTTYKKFPISGRSTEYVHVGMLTDQWDILNLLQYYAPGVHVSDYVYICHKFLCLPECVIRLAEEYLVKDTYHPRPEQLEKCVCCDVDFHALIFEKRVAEVVQWLSKGDVELLWLFSSSIDVSFTEDHLREVYLALNGSQKLMHWTLLLGRLKENNIIRDIPVSGRLAVHPLVIYYCQKSLNKNILAIAEQSCSTYTNFMCRILKTADCSMQLHGRKGQVYGCLAQEWPHIRGIMQRAIHCNTGTFEAFLRVGVQARRLIITCFPHEAKHFYKSLFESSKMYGSARQTAVLEGCLALVNTFGQGINWQLAERHIDSAIETLKEQGPVFFYKWALRRKAIFLNRQSRYQESLKYFRLANQVTKCDDPMDPNDPIRVSELQESEDDVTAVIYETTPMIFGGQKHHHKKAKLMLTNLLKEIDDRCPSHPYLDVLLLNLGLIEERGSKDLDGALCWYKRSYEVRSYLEKIVPQNMLAALHFMALTLSNKGELDQSEKHLRAALEISRSYAWVHNDTAIALTYLGEVKLRQRQFYEAFQSAVEADEIFQKSCKRHLFRLNVIMNLVHYRTLLRQQMALSRGYDHRTMNSNLMKSAEDYVQYLLDVGSTMTEHLTLEGHHFMMSAHEHGMLLHWGNSTKQFEAYKKNLIKYVQDNPCVQEIMMSDKDFEKKSEIIALHRHLFVYIQEAVSEDLELRKFCSYLHRSCHQCQISKTVKSDVDIWIQEVDFLMGTRNTGCGFHFNK